MERSRRGFLSPASRELQSIQRPSRSIADSDEQSETLIGCFADDSESTAEANGKDALQKQMGKLRWLPKWARNRLVMELVYRFAVEDKPLPLGVVAGAAIPYATMVAVSRAVFSFCFLALVLESVYCNEIGYAVFPWKVWLAWVPFQFMCTIMEIFSFRTIALPKIQVVQQPFSRRCRVPFCVWFALNLIASVVGSLDLASDGAFLGAQWQVAECERGTLFEDVWRDLWHQSMFGWIGVDSLVPSFVVTCLLAWLLNLVPITIALIQSVPCSGRGDSVDYDICHDANPAVPGAVGVFVDFPDEDVRVDEHGPWNTLYKTATSLCDGHDQNHGAALMSLAEVNAWNLVAFDDYGFAIAKAKTCMDQGKPQAAVSHVLSQTRRQTQRALGGALTNGLQLNLQMTALAMLQYDSPHMNLQSFFSISVAALMLSKRIHTAAEVLWDASGWEQKIANGMPSDSSPVKPLTKSIRFLCIAILVCIGCMVYGLAKLIMMSQCPYSLWNLSGCWEPPTGFAQAENITVRNQTVLE